VDCPKCGGEMEEVTGRWDHSLTVRSGTFTRKRPDLFACKKCGYLEFYVK